MYRFHHKCGERVTLLNDNLTAVRNYVEFNHGLVFSSQALEDDELFEVRIDEKSSLWSGGMEIGVTTLDPDEIELPATATKLRNTAWILSGSSLLMDGNTVVSSYGPELENLQEGTRLGVMKTSEGELFFFINGNSLGLAASSLPERLFAVIDLYGQCIRVTIQGQESVSDEPQSPLEEGSYNMIEPSQEECNIDLSEIEPVVDMSASADVDYGEYNLGAFFALDSDDSNNDGSGAFLESAFNRLRFHPRTGILAVLSNNNRTVARYRPYDDYNNSVVLTNRPLRNDEFFQIRIDRMIDKWSGSIEIGVTTHDPATISLPPTMTNMESGTIMMSGCKILVNGPWHCTEYGTISLDDLAEGDTVGLIRRSNGNLHFYINGIDQGVAADNIEPRVWGVIDLYGMTVQVTLLYNPNDVESSASVLQLEAPPPVEEISPTIEEEPIPNNEDSLLFYSLRDSNIIVSNHGRTARRLRAEEFFHDEIIMTTRAIKPNELFVVRLDMINSKWLSSIEIGVTQHKYDDIKLPFKMSNATSKTWVLTGEDIIKDGSILIPHYAKNINIMQEGDTLGVMVTEFGVLHFYINSVDQGPAASEIPNDVYVVLDLYGRVEQVTILDNSIVTTPGTPPAWCNKLTAPHIGQLCFHRVHGRDVKQTRNLLTALIAIGSGIRDNGIVFSSRSLRECEMFEVRVDKLAKNWLENIEIGVTALRPDEVDMKQLISMQPPRETNVTYILSGTSVKMGDEVVKSDYPLRMDCIKVGNKLGVMVHADRTLHFYLDGMDQGKACKITHLNVYALLKLYGKFTQVTVMEPKDRRSVSEYSECSNEIASPPVRRETGFSEYCGANIRLSETYNIAKRFEVRAASTLVFSATHLTEDKIFEIKIRGRPRLPTGVLRVGITDINILNAHINTSFPQSIGDLPHYTCYIEGNYIKKVLPGSKKIITIGTMIPSLMWLVGQNRLGLKRCGNEVLIYFNTKLICTSFKNVPDKVYAVIDLRDFNRSLEIAPLPGVRPIKQKVPKKAQCPIISFSPDIEDIQSESLYESSICADPIPECFANVEALQDSLIDCEDIAEGEETNIEIPLNESTLVSDPPIESPSTTETPCLVVHLPEDPPGLEDPPEEPARSASQASGELRSASIDLNNVYDICNKLDLLSDSSVLSSASSTDKILTSITLSDTSHNHATGATCESISSTENVPSPRGTFHTSHGDHIKLYSSNTVAIRKQGYNNGLVFASRPLKLCDSFLFRIDKMVNHWSGTIALGAVASLHQKVPISALDFESKAWILTGECKLVDGVLTTSKDGEALYEVKEKSIIKLLFKINRELDFIYDGRSVTIATVPKIFNEIYPVVDVYGPVKQISILLHHQVLKTSVSLELSDLSLMRTQHTAADDGPDAVAAQEATDTSEAACGAMPDHTGGIVELGNDSTVQNMTYRPTRKSYSYSGFGSLDTHRDTNIALNDHIPKSLKKKANFDKVVKEMAYFKNIIWPIDEDETTNNLEAIWALAGDTCQYLQKGFRYWRYLITNFDLLRKGLCSGYIQCYCRNCHKEERNCHMTGWVRIESSQTLSANDSMNVLYWNADKELFEAIYHDIEFPDEEQRPRRPDILDFAPNNSLDNASIWTDENDIDHEVSVSLEINICSHPDQLHAVMMFFHPPKN